MMSTQNSIISYVPQPYFVEGSCSFAGNGPDTQDVVNADGILDPDLSNYTLFVPTNGNTSPDFSVTFDKLDSYMSGFNLTFALIGCSLTTYEVDTSGNPIVETAFAEDITCNIRVPNGVSDNAVFHYSFSHNSPFSVHSFCRSALPGVISGGNANIVFSGQGAPRGNDGTAVANFTLFRLAASAAARPYAEFRIGHFFVGVDVPLIIDPGTFSFRIISANDKFKSRDAGIKASEGTLIRSAAFETIKMPTVRILGSSVNSVATAPPDDLSLTGNFFDLIKANTSYPILLNAYPSSLTTAVIPLTAEGFNLTARQNFFSIYGFLEDALEFRTDAFRDGLNSEYRARFSIRETR